MDNEGEMKNEREKDDNKRHGNTWRIWFVNSRADS